MFAEARDTRDLLDGYARIVSRPLPEPGKEVEYSAFARIGATQDRDQLPSGHGGFQDSCSTART